MQPRPQQVRTAVPAEAKLARGRGTGGPGARGPGQRDTRPHIILAGGCAQPSRNTMTVTLSVEPAASERLATSCAASTVPPPWKAITCHTASATFWSVMTPQTPSHARTTAQSSGSSVCTTTSGSAITRGRGSFSSKSPKALDVERNSRCSPFFLATRWMPVFRSWITMPPAFWIRAVSSLRSGLWSSERGRALRPRMRIARQSPQLATKSLATPPLQPGTEACMGAAAKPWASRARSAVEPSRRPSDRAF
mmetsp:Transcript_79107/g.223664  ORF Transcript_79107/g.223664 Transcript_79107/m.223664 type:complete len:251 (-) Transcript_79107:789-1541(-)